MWPYRKVTYCIYIVLVFYISVVEKKQVLPWVDSVGGSYVFFVEFPGR